jgi:hypothetical protein
VLKRFNISVFDPEDDTEENWKNQDPKMSAKFKLDKNLRTSHFSPSPKKKIDQKKNIFINLEGSLIQNQNLKPYFSSTNHPSLRIPIENTQHVYRQENLEVSKYLFSQIEAQKSSVDDLPQIYDFRLSVFNFEIQAHKGEIKQ